MSRFGECILQLGSWGSMTGTGQRSYKVVSEPILHIVAMPANSLV